MNKYIILLFILLAPFTSQAGEISLSTQGLKEANIVNWGLKIDAKYKAKSKRRREGVHFLYGKVNIKNMSNSDKSYSNKNLTISVNNLVGKTYVDSIASMALDHSQTVLKAGDSLSVKIYWAFSNPVNTKNSEVKLNWVN